MPLKPAEVRELIREGRHTNKPWHTQSAKNRRFYDGDSVSAADKRKLKKRDQKSVVINVTKPACNLVIGLLACTQMDFSAKPMVTTAKPAGKQATWGLKQVATNNDLDMLKRQWGSDAVIEGVGWLLTGAFVRDRNILEADPTQVCWIPARWGWFDLTATDPGLRNAKYIGWSHWVPVKEAVKEWPKFKQELRGLKGQIIPTEGQTTEINQLYETGDPASMPYMWGQAEWNETEKASELNKKRDEVMIHELYYRDSEKKHWYQTQDGHKHKYDPETEIEKLFNPEVVTFGVSDVPVIRRARMAGPYVLDDKSTNEDSYPMHPCFWDRDINGAPYSFVQQISDPQEEVNARRSRAWWEVAGQRVQLEDEWNDGNFDDEAAMDDLRDSVAAPDGIIKGSGVMPWPRDVSDHMAFVGMAKQEIKEAGGVTENLAGETAGKSPKSAEAQRQNTMQSGVTFEAHKQDFTFFFKLVGRRLLRLMIKHHPNPWPVMVSNQISGEDALHMITPEDIPYALDLEVGPASPTMRDKWVETIINLLPKLPPDAKLQAEAMLAALDAMDMPGVEVLETALRNYMARTEQKEAMGIPSEPAAQGAHRPRQKRVAHKTAQAAS